MNSQHWNNAKYAFIEGKGGFALTYTPWLRNLIPGIGLGYFSGYYKINDKNIVSSSFRFFSLGEINVSSAYLYSPIEFALDAGYTRLFTRHFSGGIAFRYIYSDLTGGMVYGGSETRAATSLAGDLGLYYQNDIPLGQRNAQLAFGISISNIGTPVSYVEDGEKTPIPTNLRIGHRITCCVSEHHSIALNMDMNKLMVPTSPVFAQDPETGTYYVLYGKEAPESTLAGMFQSFYDAPGVTRPDGSRSIFLEEMHEIAYSLGVEYNFDNLLLIRTGYFHEHATKGNRKYLTTGLGVKNRLFSLDVSYLVPTNGQESPLANTFRITFTTELGKTKNPLGS